MDKIQAINAFWNSFGLPAFDESTVPEYIPDGEGGYIKLVPPYITYSVVEDDFGHPVSLTASIWYRSTRWEEITQKELQIASRISRGGVMLPYNDGAVWLKKGSPFAQRVKDEDDSIRRIFMNIEAEYIE